MTQDNIEQTPSVPEGNAKSTVEKSVVEETSTIEYFESIDPFGCMGELFDFYHAMRVLSSLANDLSSGAEVYTTVECLQKVLMRLSQTLEDKLTDASTDSPEEYIIDQLEK